jgi:CTP-dependent riboflavin kinase
VDYKLNINLREELLIKDNIIVPKRGNKKRKIIELAAINLENKLNLRGNRLA